MRGKLFEDARRKKECRAGSSGIVWKMRKWEKEGYDVSELKEVLEDEK